MADKQLVGNRLFVKTNSGGGGGGEAPIQAITDYDGNQLVPDQSKVVTLPNFVLYSEYSNFVEAFNVFSETVSGWYTDLNNKTTAIWASYIQNIVYDDANYTLNYVSVVNGTVKPTVSINLGNIFAKKDDIIAADITPETLANETIPSGWYRWGFDVKLPVNYDFEILGVVSADASIGGRQTPPIVYQIEKNASPVDGYNVYVGVLFFNSTSGTLTGDLTFEAKLLIKKV